MSIQAADKKVLDRLNPSKRSKAGDYIDQLTSLAPGTPDFVIGAEATNAIKVSIQLNDQQGNAVAAIRKVGYIIADTATGGPGTAPSGGSAVTTGVALKEYTADVYADALTDDTGLLEITLTETTAKSFYLRVIIDGCVYNCDVITFA